MRSRPSDRPPSAPTFSPERRSPQGPYGLQGAPPDAWARSSRRSLSRARLAGISLRASRRTTSGTSSLPMPWPVKSTAIATRDRSAPSGSTVTSTAARIGPSRPRTAHARGGSSRTSSEVLGRSAPPIRRTVTHRAPTLAWPSSPSRWPLTTPACHSGNRVGSVVYANTSAAGRSTSAAATIGGISAALAEQGGVPVQVQRPAGVVGNAVPDGLPAGAVPVEVAVLELHPGAFGGLGDEPHLDLAGVVRVGHQLPVRPDVPTEHHPVVRLVGQDPRPAALAAVLADVDDVSADPRLEHRPGD